MHLQALLRNIASWLKPEGLVFVHIFTHKSLAYHFEVQAVIRLGIWDPVVSPDESWLRG